MDWLVSLALCCSIFFNWLIKCESLLCKNNYTRLRGWEGEKYLLKEKKTNTNKYNFLSRKLKSDYLYIQANLCLSRQTITRWEINLPGFSSLCHHWWYAEPCDSLWGRGHFLLQEEILWDSSITISIDRTDWAMMKITLWSLFCLHWIRVAEIGRDPICYNPCSTMAT